jgi:hypothetical protein
MKDLITCKICGKQSTRIYGAHLKKHGLTSREYLKLYPNAPLYTESDNKNTTKNSGKHMKQDKYRKMFSEMFKGENNPNSKSKTTEEQRKQRSPFSKSFIKYKNENEALNFQNKISKSVGAEKRPTRIEYWIKKGYTEEESKNIISKNQSTFSLKKCIEKHGEENGTKKWIERQEKWQKSLLENGKLKCGYSEISQELFYKILEKYPFEERKNIYFATKNQEYFINKDNFYQYDYTDIKIKKIIEYNSDMYHANPKIYESKDHPHPFRKWLTSKNIWVHDEDKIKTANNHGFTVLTIWDSEYRSNPDKILQECLDFLK